MPFLLRGESAVWESCLSFPYQVAAALRPYFRGVHCTRGKVAAIARAVRRDATTGGQGHLPAQNDVRGLRFMRVVLP